MKARRFLVWSVLTLVALGAVWWAASSKPASPDLLQHRLWVDRMPRGERDMIRKFVVVRSVDQGRYGVSERGSVWRHRTEVFKWGLSDSRLQLYFPQDRTVMKVGVRTWDCEGEAPDGFELCLELRGQDRTMRLYSRRDWELRPRPSDDILDDGPLSEFVMPSIVPPASEPSDEPTPTGLARLWR